jgi:hypothetical protein
MIGGLCPTAAQIAQSTYRLSRAPEFMLLDLYAGSNLLGYTASIWDKKIKDIVVGRVVGTNTIELAFYLSSVESEARREAFQAPVCKSSTFGFTAQCFKHFAETIRHLGTLVVASQRYVYVPNNTKGSRNQNGGAWVADDATNRFSFAFYRDHEIDSLEALLRSGAKKQGKGPEELAQTAVDDLFGASIVRRIAGLPDHMIQFKEQFCDETKRSFESMLKSAGNWEVTVERERDMQFRVMLKAHSDREYFYRSGLWWKAFIEVSFEEDDKKGRCSRARVYLYDSAVCGAPLSDDPDLSHRECFERIPLDSRAELDLRDRLGRVLVREYGAPGR